MNRGRGHDMRSGMNTLSLQIDEGLGRDPHCGRDLLLPRALGRLGEATLTRRRGNVALRKRL